MNKIKLMCASVAVFGTLSTAAAFATPIAPVAPNVAAKIEQVSWVCSPYGRCWWRPNYFYGGSYAYGYYPRAYYWRHRHWRHRHWW